MPEVIPYVLWAWVAVSALGFVFLTPSRASLICWFGGWLLLPSAEFDKADGLVEFPYWIMPVCLPAGVWMTKAHAIGLASLVGLAISEPHWWRRFRFSPYDLPMIGWCTIPAVSAAIGGLGIARSLADFEYQFLSWGVPYLLGRLYFVEIPRIDDLVRAWAIAGLAYLPISIIEGICSPLVYRFCYGFHPYQVPGTTRYIGYRPIGFLEDGNQLGIVLASSALASFWLWRSGRMPRLGPIPGPVVVALSMVQVLASQSAGAILLLVATIASLEILARTDRRWPVFVVLAALLGLAGLRAVNVIDAKSLAMKTAVGRAFVSASTRLDRSSFGWRLRVEERAARVALKHPIAGQGRWDWWRDELNQERPWGLFSLALGQFGLVGWTFLALTTVAPIVAFLGIGPPRFWASSRGSLAAMAGILVINGLDAWLNPCYLLPAAILAGSFVGLHAAMKRAAPPAANTQPTYHGADLFRRVHQR